MWDNESNLPENRYLFKGSSCYPLSPLSFKGEEECKDKVQISENDQLIVILKVLGK